MKPFIRYTLFNSALSALLLVLYFTVISAELKAEYQLQFTPLLLGFYFVLYTGIHFVLIKINTLKPQTFITAYTGLTGLKLLLLLGFAGIYVFLNQEIAKTFLVVFSAFYFFFAGTEIVWVYRLMKKPSP